MTSVQVAMESRGFGPSPDLSQLFVPPDEKWFLNRFVFSLATHLSSEKADEAVSSFS